MRRIAILGATSQIAKDFIRLVAEKDRDVITLSLFARRPEAVSVWLEEMRLHGRGYAVADFSDFWYQKYDAIINFVGVGDPAQAKVVGNSIFDITLRYDEMALDYIRDHPECRYLFLSSGAAYGSNFLEPASRDTRAVVAINNLQPQEWYGVAKLHAECRHRSCTESSIVDMRVFNYFSRTQDISARFLIADVFRAIRDKSILKTSADYIVRDFLHPSDFYGLINALLSAPAVNAVVDCYSLAPIDKPSLLAAMQERYGLRYEVSEQASTVNATGSKPHYYSLNRRAADFGYRPTLTSLEGVEREISAMLC